MSKRKMSYMKYNRYRRIVFLFEFAERQFVFLPAFGLRFTKKLPQMKYKYSLGFVWLNFRFCFSFGRKKEYLNKGKEKGTENDNQ